MSIGPGSFLGAYEITARIGAGGMGEVWRARDARIGRDVAVKVLPESLAGSEDRVRRFEQEARAAGTLNHPGLVTIFDVGAVDGAPYIVMELLEGQTLRELLGDEHPTRLPLRKAVDYATQIASALAVAHEKGIIHRDLKPENIFVTADGRVKILDFGLAKLTVADASDQDESRTQQRQTSPGTVMGTAGYMAPEQVRAQAVDHRADIFSLGAILYEMLSGERAFRRDSSVETMNAILKEDPPELTALDPKLPPAIEHIVRHCLEKHPRERFQSARDLAFQLRTLQDLSGSAIGSVAAARPDRKRYAIAAAIAVAALIAATAFTLLRAPARGDDLRARSFQQVTFGEGVELFPTLSPDGRTFVYVSQQSGNGDIYLQRVDGRNAINLTKDSPADEWAPAFSRDGSQIAFRSEREGGGIFTMGATGESVRRLTDFGFGPSWSPDGTRLAVATEGIAMNPRARGSTSQLWIIDARTGEKRLLLDSRDAVQPSWSPNGKRIAFWGLNGAGGVRDLFTIEPDAAEPAKTIVAVTDDPHLDWNPIWSPDGKHLYFGSDRDGTLNLWRVAIDESTGRTRGEPEPVSVPGGYTGHFTMSADGDIAFASMSSSDRIVALPLDVAAAAVGESSRVAGGSMQIHSFDVSSDRKWVSFAMTGWQEDLFIARTDGSEVRQLTNDDARDRGPAWSADGKTLYFYSNRSGEYEIWKINIDGSGLERLTDRRYAPAEVGSVWYPQPSPDGRMLAAFNGAGAVIIHLDRPIGKRFEILPPIDATRRLAQPRWSPDGATLAGTVGDVRRPSRGEGVALYDRASRRYEIISESGEAPHFIEDGRRLAWLDRESVAIADLATRQITRVPLPSGISKDRGAFPYIARDASMLYVSLREEQGDVWLMRRGTRAPE